MGDFWENAFFVCFREVFRRFLGGFWGKELCDIFRGKDKEVMKRKNYKGRCEKRTLPKCKTTCKTYDALQYAYADMLDANDNIVEIRCNVWLDGDDVAEYSSDFVCVKADGDWMVRECVFRHLLLKPKTVELLDASREYWNRRNVTDWGIVTDAETTKE